MELKTFLVLWMGLSGTLRSMEMDEISALRGLGWKQVTFVYDTDKEAARNYVQRSHKAGIMAASLQSSRLQLRLKTRLVFVEDTIRMWRVIADILFEKILDPESIMIVSRDPAISDDFEAFVRGVRIPSSFFRLSWRADKQLFSLYHFLTFRNQNLVAVNEWKYDKVSEVFHRVYDMKGGVLTVIGSSYPPEFDIFGCDHKYEKCDTVGAFSDILHEMSRVLNFTFTVTFDPEGFGSIPVSGSWYDPNATFNGVLSKIIDDSFDIAGSFWRYLHERQPWAQFSKIIWEPCPMVYISSRDDDQLDFSLFARPFSSLSWIFAALTIVSALISKLVLSKLKERSRDSSRCLDYSLWICFMLMSAYYSGALTMFFSSPTPLPFSSVKEGLKLYPNWKMIFLKVNIIDIQLPADAGDEDFKRYMELFQTKKDLAHDTIEELVNHLKLPGYFALVQPFLLAAHLNKNPDPDLRFEKLFEASSGQSSMIVPNKSPLKNAIDSVIPKLQERSIFSAIVNKWFQTPPLATPSATDMKILKIKDVILPFICFGIALVFTLFLLGFELIKKKVDEMKSSS